MDRNNNSGRTTITNKRILLVGILILASVILLIAVRFPKAEQPKLVSISEVARGVASEEIIWIEDSMVGGELVLHYRDGRTEKGVRDPNTSLLEQLNLLGLDQDQLSNVQFEIRKSTPPMAGTPLGTLFILGLVGIPLAVALFLNKRDQRVKKDFDEAVVPSIHFADVAGLDENIQELRDIVSFLKEGSKYRAVGAKMPHGVLMIGDPGTGKTLIAKAVAGEAGVPFFAMSGSEFVEVFVGVGASRIRSLFEKARKKAPCIIFIDEIDAVGRERHRSESGAEMEQDQTLNQLLVEMDGFDPSEGVLVLAATNRLDVLDSALTRAGRFDRRVYVNRPDIRGREAILALHVQGKKLAENVYLTDIAKATPGLVGADLANIVNEAAISAVRNDRVEIEMQDFEEAIEKNIAGGVQRKAHVMSEDERKIVAYHEAGHAVVMHETEYSDPVYKITIIPRGPAGGYTMSLPEQDSTLLSRRKILARITGLMGGRAAEELFFQDITSGASNDLNVATQLAEEMVMRLGMDSRSGLRVFPQLHGYAAFAPSRNSPKTIEAIDEAVGGILEECYNEAKKILTDRSERVVKLAQELLEVETINREHFSQLMAEGIS